MAELGQGPQVSELIFSALILGRDNTPRACNSYTVANGLLPSG